MAEDRKIRGRTFNNDLLDFYNKQHKKGRTDGRRKEYGMKSQGFTVISPAGTKHHMKRCELYGERREMENTFLDLAWKEETNYECK